MSVDTLYQQGVDYYKRGDYAKAVGFLNRAVSRLQSVKYLDRRAACHEKLNDLPAALKDAKKTIQLAREDPTGYLRAGRILMKMERSAVAYDIYSLGLKAVRYTRQGYDALRQRHNELQSQISPPKSIDPFTVLPRELALLILKHLDFRERILVSRVSKQWDKFVRSEPDLWKHLDLSQARNKVKSSFISKCINTARTKLTSATLNKVTDFDKTLRSLVRFCPIESLTLLDTGLQSLQLSRNVTSVTNLRELRLGSGTEIQTLSIIDMVKHHWKTLEVLEIEQHLPRQIYEVDLYFPRLKVLRLTVIRVTGGHEQAYKAMIELSPELQSLTFVETITTSAGYPHEYGNIDLGTARHLTYLDLTMPPSFTPQDIVLPRSLRILRLQFNNSGYGPLRNPSDLFPSQICLPKLETVEFCSTMTSMEGLLKWLGLVTALRSNAESSATEQDDTTLSKIKSLTVKQATLDGDFSTWSNSRLDELEHLALCTPVPYESSERLNDTDLQFIADLRHLRTLDLSETAVTGVGIKKVVNAGSVKHLILNNCQSVSKDAVDWARSKGVRVEHKTHSVPSSGKKVRYERTRTW